MTILVVTGTGTEIGKTVVTRRLSRPPHDGLSVAVLKPAQTDSHLVSAATPPRPPGCPER